jgi:hypothetical protein
LNKKKGFSPRRSKTLLGAQIDGSQILILPIDWVFQFVAATNGSLRVYDGTINLNARTLLPRKKFKMLSQTFKTTAGNSD